MSSGATWNRPRSRRLAHRRKRRKFYGHRGQRDKHADLAERSTHTGLHLGPKRHRNRELRFQLFRRHAHDDQSRLLYRTPKLQQRRSVQWNCRRRKRAAVDTPNDLYTHATRKRADETQGLACATPSLEIGADAVCVCVIGCTAESGRRKESL